MNVNELALANNLANAMQKNKVVFDALVRAEGTELSEVGYNKHREQISINHLEYKVPEGMDDDLNFCFRYLQARAQQRYQDAEKALGEIGNPNKRLVKSDTNATCEAANIKTPYPHP